MPAMENLGLKIAEHDGGETVTTWFSQDGKTSFHGRFNPFIRLYDDGGTEVVGALQKRYGMPPGITDQQPGYGTHADAGAQIGGIIQRAVNAGWFSPYGILSGTIVNGSTIGSGLNKELLVDCMYIFMGMREKSELVQRFQDKQPVPVDPMPELAKSLDALYLQHKKKHPETVSPLGLNQAELRAVGIDIATPQGQDTFYSYIAQRLTKDIQDGVVNPEAEPAGEHYSFVTMPVSVFLRWQGIVAGKS